MSSGPSLSNTAQVHYMITWFEEWSELQRQDFLPILADKMATNGEYVNGIVNSVNNINCQDKPLNLFQCRIKLFNQWFASWNDEERNRLVERISGIDQDFGKKLQEEITGNKQVIDGEQEVNAIETEHQDTPEESAQEVENQEVIADQEEVEQVLINETNIPVEITAE